MLPRHRCMVEATKPRCPRLLKYAATWNRTLSPSPRVPHWNRNTTNPLHQWSSDIPSTHPPPVRRLPTQERNTSLFHNPSGCRNHLHLLLPLVHRVWTDIIVTQNPCQLLPLLSSHHHDHPPPSDLSSGLSPCHTCQPRNKKRRRPSLHLPRCTDTCRRRRLIKVRRRCHPSTDRISHPRWRRHNTTFLHHRDNRHMSTHTTRHKWRRRKS